MTQIAAGTQHNVVPDTCRFVADVRTTDAYTNEETVEILRRALRSEVTPRSTRIRASALNAAHPLARADEFVLLPEIEEGIGIYEKFITQLAETL